MVQALKIFLLAQLNCGSKKKGSFEIYDSNRYFTVTGRRLRKSPRTVNGAHDFANELRDMFPTSTTWSIDLDWETEDHPDGVSDEKIIRRLKLDSQFGNQDAYQLWKGDLSAHGHDHSSCDFALVNHIAYYVGPYPTIIDRIFRQSGLMREKWNREDYRSNTISGVLSDKDQFHTWRSIGHDNDVRENHQDDDVSWSLPSELLVVPGFIELVRQYTLRSSHKEQPVLSLAGALSLLAALLGNRVFCEQGCYTNLLTIMVGATGCGKDRPRRTNNEILTACDAAYLLSCENPASGPAILRAMEEYPVQLSQIDEFGRFLSTARDAKSNAHSVVSEMMKLATSPGQTIRKPYADTKRTFQVNNPVFVLLGATTPDAMFDAVSDSSLQDGFIPRLDLWVGEDYPEPTGFCPHSGVPG